MIAALRICASIHVTSANPANPLNRTQSRQTVRKKCVDYSKLPPLILYLITVSTLSPNGTVRGMMVTICKMASPSPFCLDTHHHFSCKPNVHLCGETCHLRDKRGCQESCAKGIGHKDEGHVCAAARHQCGQVLVSHPHQCDPLFLTYEFSHVTSGASYCSTGDHSPAKIFAFYLCTGFYHPLQLHGTPFLN